MCNGTRRTCVHAHPDTWCRCGTIVVRLQGLLQQIGAAQDAIPLLVFNILWAKSQKGSGMVGRGYAEALQMTDCPLGQKGG